MSDFQRVLMKRLVVDVVDILRRIEDENDLIIFNIKALLGPTVVNKDIEQTRCSSGHRNIRNAYYTDGWRACGNYIVTQTLGSARRSTRKAYQTADPSEAPTFCA